MNKPNQTRVVEPASKGSLFIKQQVHKGHSDREDIEGDLINILGDRKNSEIELFNKGFGKIIKGRKIIKKVIYPLIGLINFIDEVIYVKKTICDLKIALSSKNEDVIKDIEKQFGVILTQRKSHCSFKEITEEIISRDGELEKTASLLSIINKIYANEPNQMIHGLLGILDNEAESISLRGSMSTGDYEEIPSFNVFLETIKLEVNEYLKKLNFLGIDGDTDIINSIMIGQWLKEQKNNTYIKLPFFDEMIRKIDSSRRNGKVGQVVLKGPPGTGKTRIFEYLGEKLRRPIKVISMHEYINFYELLIQTTNLSPSKNQIEFIETIIQDYKNIGGEGILRNLGVLFDKNKDKFPSTYNLLDFINNIFDSSKYTGDTSNKQKLNNITEPEEVKQFVIKSLIYWKNEKIFKLLLNKKEVIEGELLNCISNGEIPLLDEIDKVKEKEVNGILSFLDLETGKYHKIQGIDREIYIPEWFGVYATSNDNLKPSGPLGRRFNSVHFDFLDIENMTMYLVSRIVDNELSCPFDNKELEQIEKCLKIIAEAIEDNKDDGSYKYLDFSIRLLDNFINSFIKIKDGMVQKKFSAANKDSYIYEALQNAFEMQTEDIYGNLSSGSSSSEGLGRQKSKIIGIIDESIKEIEEKTILSGVRLSKGVKARVNAVLRKIDLNNVLLQLILRDQELKYTNGQDIKTRVLNYSEQVTEILMRSDYNLRGIIKKGKEKKLENKTKILIKTQKHIVQLDYNSGKNVLKITVDEENSINYGCESIVEIIRDRCYLVNQGEALGGYIILEIVDNGDEHPIKITELTENINRNWGKIHDIIINNGKVIIHKINKNGKGKSTITYSEGRDVLKIEENNAKNYEGVTKVSLDESGLFLLVYHKEGENVEIINLVNDDFDGEFKGVSYKERMGEFETILNIGIESFGLGQNEGYKIEDIKIDSTFEYIFVQIKNSEGTIINNTIKL